MAGKIIESKTNKHMQKILKKRGNLFKRVDFDRLQARIAYDLSQLKYRADDSQHWIVADRCKPNMEDIERRYGDLVGYEWSCNELYYEGELFNQNFKDTVPFVLDTVKKILSESYPNEKFFICVDAQTGRLSNITIHFHLHRENCYYIDRNVENYLDACSYEIVDFSGSSLDNNNN